MLKYIYIPSSLKYMRENYNVCRPTLLRDVLAVPAESQKNENTAISWISLKERIPFLLFTRNGIKPISFSYSAKKFTIFREIKST